MFPAPRPERGVFVADNGDSKRPVPPSPEEYAKLHKDAEELRQMAASGDSDEARHRQQVQDGMQAYARYTGIGMQFVLTMLLPMGGGWLLDDWLGTSPWLLLAGAALGGVAGMVFVVRTVFRMESKDKARKKASEEARETKGKP